MVLEEISSTRDHKATVLVAGVVPTNARLRSEVCRLLLLSEPGQGCDDEDHSPEHSLAGCHDGTSCSCVVAGTKGTCNCTVH
jgi:hypothetical protein